jgi:putative endonuclease
MCVNTKDLWVVYILQCSDDTLYTGVTNNIHKRYATHQAGKGAKYTRGRLPVKLLELFPCDNKSSALKLEYKIKQLSRAKKLELCNEASISTKLNP